MKETRLALEYLDSHIRCGAGRLRRRSLDGRTSRQGDKAQSQHRGADLVRHERISTGEFPSAHYLFKKDSNATTLNVEKKKCMKDAAANSPAEMKAMYETCKSSNCLPARECLWLHDRKKRTSGRAVSDVLFALH